MGSTTNLALPWPELGLIANGSAQIKALAEALDASGLIYKPYVEIQATASTSVGTGTITKINLANTAHIDGGASFFTVAASVITVVQAGVYDLSAMAEITSGTDDQKIIMITKNGTTNRVAQLIANGPAIYGSPCALAVTLAANDTLQLVGYSATSAGTAAYVAVSDVARLVVRKVG